MCGSKGDTVTTSIPPLLGLHAYEAAARHLSFAAAAAELHLSASAVSQRVRTLEAHLGVPLFERLPRSLRLTDAGESYLPAVRVVFEDLSAATSGLFGGRHRSRLTVRVQVSYASTWLAPRLPDFCAAYPQVDVRLVSTVWADALPPSQIDLEVRQGNGSWPGFVAAKLHDDAAVVICGPGYLERFGAPRRLSDLVTHGRVQVLGFDDLWRRLFTGDHPGDSTGDSTGDGTGDQDWGGGSPAPAVTVDTSASAVELVAAGDLWAIVPERFARRAVRAGRVVLAHDGAVAMRQAHYLLRRDDASLPSGEAVAFGHWLRAQDALDAPLVPAEPTADG